MRAEGKREELEELFDIGSAYLYGRTQPCTLSHLNLCSFSSHSFFPKGNMAGEVLSKVTAKTSQLCPLLQMEAFG